MSSREKQLLSLLLLAGFIIVNVFLYSLYSQKITQAKNNLQLSTANLQQAIFFQESSSQLAEQIVWLAENEPPPSDFQTIQSQLQKFSADQATTLGLTIKDQALLPTDTAGFHYHRAQIKINLTGREQALYSWFSAINDPNSFRSAYQIRLSPNTQEDSLIDCSATISQWFPPAS